LDPNPRPESSHGPLNLTLDLEYAHVRVAVETIVEETVMAIRSE